jgi:hypothetical protein
VILTGRAEFIDFGSEKEAVAYVHRRIAPYCKSITPEVRLKSGRRPDFGIRLAAIPDMPIVVECKHFRPGSFNPLPECIAQASDYANELKVKGFVAPIQARGVSKFGWQWSPIGAALLVGQEINVGALYFCEEREGLSDVGGLILGGQSVARFHVNRWGDPETTLAPNARLLLTYKNRAGSQAWREAQGQS